MSRIRADKFVNNAANGAPQLTYGVEVIAGVGLTGAGGINITGIATAASFSGNLTGNATGLSGTPNIDCGTGSFTGDVDIADKIVHTGDTNTAIRFPAADTFTVETAGSERLRVTSGGPVLINTTTSRATHGSGEAQLQIEGTNTATAGLSITRKDDGSGSPTFSFGKTRDGSVVQNNDNLGVIYWQADDGTDLATPACSINAVVDGTPGSNDMPGRLVFNTTADGASTPTERLRITSAGVLFVAGTGGMNTTQLPNGSTININGNSSNDGFSVIRYSSGYGAYGLNIGRSKSGTVGTNAIVSDGNELGHITFYGADGSSYLKASQITAQVDGTPSAGSGMPGRLIFKTSPSGSATPTEKLRILSSGGITFNGDTATANALDDYEEGTWTPTGNNNFNGISNADGAYVKVGKIVWISYQFNYTSLDNSSGSSAVAGLPFTPGNANPNTGVEATGVCYANNKLVFAYPQDTTNILYFETHRPLNGSASTSADFFRGSIVYST